MRRRAWLLFSVLFLLGFEPGLPAGPDDASAVRLERTGVFRTKGMVRAVPWYRWPVPGRGTSRPVGKLDGEWNRLEIAERIGQGLPSSLEQVGPSSAVGEARV